MLQRDAAPGIHRVQDAAVNWYLVEGEGGLTVVDAGLPGSWQSLQGAVATIGRRLEDVAAVVLTHGHFDHVGFAERARVELGVPVWVHPDDRTMAAHPLRYPFERPFPLYLWRPRAAAMVLSMLVPSLRVEGVQEARTFADGDELPVPGRPRVVLCAGHTPGHCALHLPDRDALLSGDACVTLDPYTARRGPRVVARAATADSVQAFASLERLAETGARIVLSGHGEPWREGAEAMVSRARRVGIG
jgi:glyoxylase-like metal-dependent hydrolase (beta-lactamase superfamily II)